MTQAVDIIKLSLQTIGKETEMQKADPSLYEAGLLYLQSLLAYFKEQEIRIFNVEPDGSESYIVIPQVLTDDINEPLSARTFIINFLAVEFSTIARVPLDQLGIMNRERDRGYSILAQMFRDHVIDPIVPDGLLPYGAGNNRGRQTRFFQGALEQSNTVTVEDEYIVANDISEAIDALND